MAVSTPVRLAAAVDEAVIIGQVVQLMNLHHGGSSSIVEYTVPAGSALASLSVTELGLPAEAVLLGVVRGAALLPPAPELQVRAADELILLVAADADEGLRTSLAARGQPKSSSR